jgi:hypothetical protein
VPYQNLSSLRKDQVKKKKKKADAFKVEYIVEKKIPDSLSRYNPKNMTA